MFSILTSKIFGGLSIALALAFVGLLISKNAVIRSDERTINTQINTISSLNADLATARANASQLDAGLKQCNASAKSAAQMASAVAKAGLAAVEQVRRAGVAVPAKLDHVTALPEATCVDADAILLEGAK